MIQDRLLTVNRWNKRKFLFGGDTNSLNSGNNNFSFNLPELGSSNWGNLTGGTGGSGQNRPIGLNGLSGLSGGSGSNGSNGLSLQNSTWLTDQFNEWNAGNRYNSSATMRGLADNFDWRQVANRSVDADGKFDWKGAGLAAASAALDTPAGDKLLDTMDPVYHLAGGRESTVGNALSSAGKGVFKAGVSTGNPWLMLAGAGAKVVGGLTNAAFGTKWNKDNINDVENNITGMRQAGSGLAGAKTNSDILGNWGNVDMGYSFGNGYIGKDGWFTNKAKKKANRLRDKQSTAQDYVTNALVQGLGNVDKRNNRMVMSDYVSNAAFGGPLDMIGNNDMGAIGYGFMSDYLNMKNRQVAGKGGGSNYLGSLGSIGSMGNGFASGGEMDMRSNGVWSNGVSNEFASGGKIHINPKNKGKLTETARRTGKSFEELAHSKNPLTRKRAQFALNARKWKHSHEDGGVIGVRSNGVSDFYGLNRPIGHNGLIGLDGYYGVNGLDGVDGAYLPDGYYGLEGLYALGGDLQSNGGDYSTGLRHIDEGSSHEENPYEGVQMGLASDGEPNLVEEGETIFNDYVFSNRLKPSKKVLKEFHLFSKGGKLTYADVSKKLEKEAEERPNDPMSRAALKKQMERLMEAQEEQKAEQEAREARKAFEQMTPEEQEAVLRSIGDGSNGGSSNGVEEEGVSSEGVVGDGSNGIRSNGVVGDDDAYQDIPQEALTGAFGGELGKKYAKGGWRDALANIFNRRTAEDWNSWAAKQGLKDFDFDKIEDIQKFVEDNPDFVSALAKENAGFADALNRGYDFGAYTPGVNGYNLPAFNEKLSKYLKSKNKGNTPNNYAIDTDFGQYLNGNPDINALEASKAYRDYSDALVNVANAVKGARFNLNNGVLENVNGGTVTPENLALLNTLYATANGTSTNPNGDPVPMFVKNDDGTYSIANNAKQLLIGDDGNGGLRYDHKAGIFHLSPEALERANESGNYLIKSDGSVVPLYGDTKGYKTAGSYTWDDPEGRRTVNYFNEGDGSNSSGSNGERSNGEFQKLPYESTAARKAGIIAPAVGLGLHFAGVGKPDTSGLDGAMEYLRGADGYVNYTPIGGYQRYNPLDVWIAMETANAKNNGVQRAIMNSYTPVGTRNAALIANNYANQLGTGELIRQGHQYNDAQSQQVAAFNRETDKANAEAALKASMANAEIKNNRAKMQASLAADTAAKKMEADAEWNNALYQGLSNLGRAISNYGKEAEGKNMVRAYLNSGAAGPITPEMAAMTGVYDWNSSGSGSSGSNSLGSNGERSSGDNRPNGLNGLNGLGVAAGNSGVRSGGVSRPVLATTPLVYDGGVEYGGKGEEEYVPSFFNPYRSTAYYTPAWEPAPLGLNVRPTGLGFGLRRK